MNISRNIRKIRELRNLTQEFLADELNVSQSTYCRIEHGSVKVDFIRLCQIAGVLQVNYRLLVDFNENEILKSFSFEAPAYLLETSQSHCAEGKPDHCVQLLRCIEQIKRLHEIINNFHSSDQSGPASLK
jgi:transcriptional regulator with XRE-family HTH domain